jgi:hypothetical protein
MAATPWTPKSQPWLLNPDSLPAIVASLDGRRYVLDVITTAPEVPEALEEISSTIDPESRSALVTSESLPTIIPFEDHDQWPVFNHTTPVDPATESSSSIVIEPGLQEPDSLSCLHCY